MKTTQDKLDTAIVQYKRSIQLLMILPHGVLFTFFFPSIVLTIITMAIIFVVMFVWCDLIHTMEEAHRNDILNLLHTCEIPETRNLLAYELYLHDENSLAGHRPCSHHRI